MRGRSAWLLVGAVVVGWLVVPQAVSAVGTIVTIQGGGSSTKASVTDGKQLQVAEAAPSSFREYVKSTSDAACHVLVTVPSDKGFVIRTVSIDVALGSTGGFEIATVYPNGTCTGADVFSAPTQNAGTHEVTIDPGFAIASNDKISFEVGNTTGVVAAYVWGYMVPSADVPSTTTIN